MLQIPDKAMWFIEQYNKDNSFCASTYSKEMIKKDDYTDDYNEDAADDFFVEVIGCESIYNCAECIFGVNSLNDSMTCFCDADTREGISNDVIMERLEPLLNEHKLNLLDMLEL